MRVCDQGQYDLPLFHFGQWKCFPVTDDAKMWAAYRHWPIDEWYYIAHLYIIYR